MGSDPSDLFFKGIRKITGLVSVIMFLMLLAFVSLFVDVSNVKRYFATNDTTKTNNGDSVAETQYWLPPDSSRLSEAPDSALIRYGRQLIANTSHYLGPHGRVAKTSNGMNCQNCHLEAGTKIFGNNYSAVASTYPKFRARSGTKETIEKRVNDCFERSLNGKPLTTDSREMKAIVAYMKWLGKDVERGNSPEGSGLVKLKYLDRPADPTSGKKLYENICSACHGKSGQGVLKESGIAYQYPPLWGENSYNFGAGLYRLSNLARFIKANMPLGATHAEPILTDEQSWDIAAYVNSLPRPTINLSNDWPNISKKPFDHPFGPYSDTFSERQHKFGPFHDIVKNKQ